jgi:hypothetical protein
MHHHAATSPHPYLSRQEVLRQVRALRQRAAAGVNGRHSHLLLLLLELERLPLVAGGADVTNGRPQVITRAAPPVHVRTAAGMQTSHSRAGNEAGLQALPCKAVRWVSGRGLGGSAGVAGVRRGRAPVSQHASRANVSARVSSSP